MEDKNLKDLFDLVNLEVPLKFEGVEYRVKKASLAKAVSYQRRIIELRDNGDLPDVSKFLKGVSYCFYLVLKDVIPDLTEERVEDNLPADINALDALVYLGFMSPRSLEKIQENPEEKSTTNESLPISQE